MLSTTSAVLLAGGGGRRFAGDTHKLLALLDGQPVVSHAVDTVRRAGLGHVIVVTGAVDLPDTIDRNGLIVVVNEEWAMGQATSLQAGIDAARGLGSDSVVVGLGDQPFIGAEAWRAVANASAPIAVATYEGRRGNPVRLDRSIWDLLPRKGDQGARSLMSLRPELVGEVACSGSPADIDTMEDLQRWNSSTNSP